MAGPYSLHPFPLLGSDDASFHRHGHEIGASSQSILTWTRFVPMVTTVPCDPRWYKGLSPGTLTVTLSPTLKLLRALLSSPRETLRLPVRRARSGHGRELPWPAAQLS